MFIPAGFEGAIRRVGGDQPSAFEKSWAKLKLKMKLKMKLKLVTGKLLNLYYPGPRDQQEAGALLFDCAVI